MPSDPELKDFPTVSLETKIMQDFSQNLQTLYLVEDPNRFLDLDYLGPCGSESSLTYDNRQPLMTNCKTCVPKFTNLLSSEVLPLLWSNVSCIQHLLLLSIKLRTISRTCSNLRERQFPTRLKDRGK
jgi:hypothetical protein